MSWFVLLEDKVSCAFGEEGCLWFLLFQEEVERKAEVLEKKIFLFWGHVKHKIKLA